MGYYRGLQTAESRDSVEHWSSNDLTARNPQQTSVTVFFGAMDSRCFIRGNKIHYELARNTDKYFVTIEGSTHSSTPGSECDKTKWQYGNSVKIIFWTTLPNGALRL